MNKKAQIDLGELNWPIIMAFWLVCVAVLMPVKIALTYKIVIGLLALPVCAIVTMIYQNK